MKTYHLFSLVLPHFTAECFTVINQLFVFAAKKVRIGIFKKRSTVNKWQPWALQMLTYKQTEQTSPCWRHLRRRWDEVGRTVLGFRSTSGSSIINSMMINLLLWENDAKDLGVIADLKLNVFLRFLTLTSETQPGLDRSSFVSSLLVLQTSQLVTCCWLEKPDTIPPPCFLQALRYMTTSLLLHLVARVINFRKVQLVVKSLKGLASHYAIDLFPSLTPADDLSWKQRNKKDFRSVQMVLFFWNTTLKYMWPALTTWVRMSSGCGAKQVKILIFTVIENCVKD